jgi:hypothetical protein
VSGAGCRVQGAGFKVEVLGFRLRGLEFMVEPSAPPASPRTQWSKRAVLSSSGKRTSPIHEAMRRNHASSLSTLPFYWESRLCPCLWWSAAALTAAKQSTGRQRTSGQRCEVFESAPHNASYLTSTPSCLPAHCKSARALSFPSRHTWQSESRVD